MKNPITLQGFKDFVKTQSGEYNFYDTRDCAFAQYLKSEGIPFTDVSGSYYRDHEGNHINFPDGRMHVAIAVSPHTFEDLSERLDAITDE